MMRRTRRRTTFGGDQLLYPDQHTTTWTCTKRSAPDGDAQPYSGHGRGGRVLMRESESLGRQIRDETFTSPNVTLAATLAPWCHADPDPGRPIELFGAAFGPTFDAQTWQESDLFVGSDSIVERARDPFPFVFQHKSHESLHVEDSVRGLHNENLTIPLCDDAGGICPFTATP